MGMKLERVLGALNGLVGDHLARTENGLATEMNLVAAGAPVRLTREALKEDLPKAEPRVVILVHGSMGTEADWDYPDGSTYGTLLERDLAFTPLYLRYNTGQAIADNGAELSRLLEAFEAAYPVALDELLLVGHSMGGLVIRSACHDAQQRGAAWLGKVKRAIYVGTPHRGAPLERAGRVVTKLLDTIDDPYTQLAASLAKLRSAGIQDLGDADLRHQDRAERVPDYALREEVHPVPLLPSIHHLLIAGSVSTQPILAQFLGDAVVPLESATNAGGLSAEVRVVPSIPHPILAHHPDVYAEIHRWLEASP